MNIIDGNFRTPMDFGWTQSLIGAMIPYYGLNGSAKIASVILPGILKDFRKCLKDAAVGAEIKEEYTVDDGKVTIRLVGSRRMQKGAAANVLHEVYVNEEAVVINGMTRHEEGIGI
ncbi:MAG: hypothetical protein E7236_04370 [Lachnospiraceae bacterium]|nr:hypothetical protein [Lachnospiraceae bacterium]